MAVIGRERLRRLLFATPTLLVAALVAVATSGLDGGGQATRYERLADESYEQQDWATCQLQLRRLLDELPPSSPSRLPALLKLARVAQEMGRSVEAQELYNYLAPLDGRGFAPAHFLAAERLLEAGKTDVAAYHLRRVAARKGAPQRSEAAAMLGLLLAEGQADPSEALTAIDEARRMPRPRLGLVLDAYTTLFERAPNDAAVREQAQAGAEEVAKQLIALNRYPDDLLPTQKRLQLARAHEVLGQEERAIELLEGGLGAISESAPAEAEALRLALARTSVRYAGTLGADDVRFRALLDRALVRGQPDLLLVSGLLALEGRHAAFVRQSLEAMLDAAPPDRRLNLLFLLGTAHLEASKARSALRYLEQAFEIAQWRHPGVPVNLAECLIALPQPDLERARSLIEEARKRWPGDVRIEDCHGRLLSRMGQDQEALRILQGTLDQGLVDEHVTLLEISRIYGRLGSPELQEAYARRAELKASQRRARIRGAIWGSGD